MTAQEYLVSHAKSYIGYREKSSAKDLDSFTANAGSRNYTRFAYLLDGLAGYLNGKKQGAAWCAVFAMDMFVECFTAPVGWKMTYQPKKSLGAGVRYLRGYFKKAKQLYMSPQVGDIIFFTDPAKNDPNYGKHTGIVSGFDKTYVETVEGNKNNAVATGRYRLTDPSISGYGRPNWGLVAADFPDIKQYTVTVPGLTQAQADGLLAAWPRATKAVG